MLELILGRKPTKAEIKQYKAAEEAAKRDKRRFNWEPTEVEIKQWEAEKLDWQRFELILNICLEHYIAKDTKRDLGNFTEMVVKASNAFERLGSKGRNQLVGAAITTAFAHGSNEGETLFNNKQVFGEPASELVDMAVANGQQLKDDSAYDFVAKLMYTCGVRDAYGKAYGGRAIRSWCSKSNARKSI